MSNRVSMVIVMLLLLGGAHALPHFTFCSDGITVDEAKGAVTDSYEVWYLEAPVFEGAFGNLFEYLKGFHCAFGFKNVDNPKNSFVVEYDAVYEVLNATLPFIVEKDNVTSLKWYDAGGICIERKSNWTYFDYKQQLVTTEPINGKQFNSFLDWVTIDNSTNTKYQLWNLYNTFKNASSPIYLNSSTCVDFQWRGFDELYRLGAKYDYSLELRGDFINIYGLPPAKRSIDDPVWGPKIIGFYKEFDTANIHSFKDFLKFLENILLGTFFIHETDGSYWHVRVMLPIMENRYARRPLPGHPTLRLAA